MAKDFYGYEDEDSRPRGRDNLFLWTVFILLLTGIAFACWMGSFYIFGHPEVPRAYRILKKLHKIEPPRRFEVTAAPPGEFMSAQKLFEKYGKYSRLQLASENALLMRNYISNYRETTKLVPYIRGRFNILDSYELTGKDFFGSGVVALAQAAEYPQVLIEHVYTAPKTTVSLLKGMLQTGLDMNIERTLDLSAILHIDRVEDGRLILTVVPLLYGTYALKQGSGTFGLEPPAEVQIDAPVPITSTEKLQAGLQKFASYRQLHPPPATADANSQAPAPPQRPELVRLDAIPEGAKVPLTGALPEMPVATPIPMAGRATPKPPKPPLLAANSTPPPRPIAPPATPPPAPIVAVEPPAATPVPTATPPKRTSPEGVPLTPFIAANPAPGLPSANPARWRTYTPGKLPPGRSLTAGEAGSLADRGDLGERLYLKGRFVVTASRGSKAVLRPQGANDTDSATPTRIIVEYPAGAVPPREGATFARDESRGYEVQDVRRGNDGQVNITVREVIQP